MQREVALYWAIREKTASLEKESLSIAMKTVDSAEALRLIEEEIEIRNRIIMYSSDRKKLLL